MTRLWKVLNIFFVVLGVVFLCLLIAGAYVIIADPFHIMPIVRMLRAPIAAPGAPTPTSTPPAATPQKPSTVTPKTNPLITPEEMKTFESFGINPASLPTVITPALEACFVEKLGAARVAEIKQGSAPGVADLFLARSCIGN